jgi:hypothetical protein
MARPSAACARAPEPDIEDVVRRLYLKQEASE